MPQKMAQIKELIETLIQSYTTIKKKVADLEGEQTKLLKEKTNLSNTIGNKLLKQESGKGGAVNPENLQDAIDRHIEQHEQVKKQIQEYDNLLIEISKKIEQLNMG